MSDLGFQARVGEPPCPPRDDMGDVLASIRRMIAHDPAPLPPQAPGVLRLDDSARIDADAPARPGLASWGAVPDQSDRPFGTDTRDARAEALQWALSEPPRSPALAAAVPLAPVDPASAAVTGHDDTDQPGAAAVPAPDACNLPTVETTVTSHSFQIDQTHAAPQPMPHAAMTPTAAQPAATTPPAAAQISGAPTIVTDMVRHMIREALSGDGGRAVREIVLQEIANVLTAPATVK